MAVVIEVLDKIKSVHGPDVFGHLSAQIYDAASEAVEISENLDLTAEGRAGVERAFLLILRKRYPDLAWTIERPSEGSERDMSPPTRKQTEPPDLPSPEN